MHNLGIFNHFIYEICIINANEFVVMTKIYARSFNFAQLIDITYNRNEVCKTIYVYKRNTG